MSESVRTMPAELELAPDALRIGSGRCPLVLGEFVQGRMDDDRYFLITAPIHAFSRAEFLANGSTEELEVRPADCCKALAAVELFLQRHGLPLSGLLQVRTGARVSLGFGTSTADITSAVRAAASAWGCAAAPREIADIAARIEPSDGSMYAGSVAFAQREGVLLERFGALPRFHVLSAVAGAGVDTVEFDRIRRGVRYSQADREKLRCAWSMMRFAVRSDRAELLGRAGSISAAINQKLLPNPLYDELRQVAIELGTLGLMVAHSGSLIGLVLDPLRPDFPRLREQAGAVLEELAPGSWFEASNYEPPVGDGVINDQSWLET